MADETVVDLERRLVDACESDDWYRAANLALRVAIMGAREGTEIVAEQGARDVIFYLRRMVRQEIERALNPSELPCPECDKIRGEVDGE